MKVEVMQLRRDGRRLSDLEEMEAGFEGRAGWLSIFQHRDVRGRRTVIARLAPAADNLVDSVFEQLEDVGINAMKGPTFVLVGLQHSRRGDKVFATHQQAWLCRVLPVYRSPLADAP